MKYFVFSILFLCFILPFSNVNAQTPTNSDDFNVEMTPSSPGPNQTVNVTLTSYVFNIDSASINWIVNGSSKKSGKGERSFSFATGGVGDSTNLRIVVETADGITLEKSITIKPSEIDMIWETEGYTPPFYKGKAIFSYQNKINFIAIPHITSSNGVEVSNKNLIYKWKNNGSVIEGASGYGKNVYSIVGSIIARPLDITVEVSSINGNTTTGRIQVSPKDPSILLYEKNPLYGIVFQKSLTGTEEMKEKEITVVGMPYFFGTKDSNSPDLEYKWYINGTFIKNSFDQNIQVFRQKEGVSGTSNISLSIENTNKVLQTANNNFSLKFESPETTEGQI